MGVKIRLFFIILSFLVAAYKPIYAATIEESLTYTLQNNQDLNLEKARLDKAKASKGDIFVEFLPDVKASMQKGRQQNDALGIDRGDLDKINVTVQ